jgi:hypothetical protein
MKIIGYTYEADTHCVACTQKRFKQGELAKRRLREVCGLDENGIALATTDNEGNRVQPIFSTDEESQTCGDCFTEIR